MLGGDSLDVGLTFLWLGTWFVQLFFILLHTACVAMRMPNRDLHRFAMQCIWLLPVIGALVGIGTIAAAYLYWRLLDRTRTQIKLIEEANISAR